MGTGTIASQDKVYGVHFKEAREFVGEIKFERNKKNGMQYCASGNRPDDIPANPRKTLQKRFQRIWRLVEYWENWEY